MWGRFPNARFRDSLVFLKLSLKTRFGKRPLLGRLVSVVLVVVVAACCRCGAPDDPGRVIAVLDDKQLSFAELEAYFAINMLQDSPAELSGEQHDEVQSRLFDNFIDEQLLLLEAQRSGIQVDDAELVSYLSSQPAGTQQSPHTEGHAAGAARQALMVQKFRDRFLRQEVTVADQEVERFLSENRDDPMTERQFTVRSLLLSSPEQAEEAYRKIREGTMTFGDAVAAHATAPGQGVPLEISEEGLPPPLRDAITQLAPEEVTRPVELHGSVYLFQLVSRQQATVPDQEDLRTRARNELARQRGQQALEELLQELRSEARLTVLWRNLPFNYVPEYVPPDPR